MIMLVLPVAAVNSVATDADDVIFHLSLLSSQVADVNAARRYYDTWPL
jgi:hypothetical protein